MVPLELKHYSLLGRVFQDYYAWAKIDFLFAIAWGLILYGALKARTKEEDLLLGQAASALHQTLLEIAMFFVATFLSFAAVYAIFGSQLTAAFLYDVPTLYQASPEGRGFVVPRLRNEYAPVLPLDYPPLAPGEYRVSWRPEELGPSLERDGRRLVPELQRVSPVRGLKPNPAVRSGRVFT